MQSFGDATPISFQHCIYREGATEAASSYIIRSKETGSRTLVNYNALDEMTVAEFEAIARDFRAEGKSWWHFEVSDTGHIMQMHRGEGEKSSRLISSN